MKTASATLALIMVIAQIIAAMGSEWCAEGCCTTHGASGFCTATEKEDSSLPEHQNGNECQDDENDCCIELPDDDQLVRGPFADGHDCDLTPLTSHAALIITVNPQAKTQQRFLLPQAIGPPWQIIKESTELLI